MYHTSLERLFHCYNHDLPPRGCPTVWGGETNKQKTFREPLLSCCQHILGIQTYLVVLYYLYNRLAIRWTCYLSVEQGISWQLFSQTKIYITRLKRQQSIEDILIHHTIGFNTQTYWCQNIFPFFLFCRPDCMEVPLKRRLLRVQSEGFFFRTLHIVW